MFGPVRSPLSSSTICCLLLQGAALGGRESRNKARARDPDRFPADSSARIEKLGPGRSSRDPPRAPERPRAGLMIRPLGDQGNQTLHASSAGFKARIGHLLSWAGAALAEASSVTLTSRRRSALLLDVWRAENQRSMPGPSGGCDGEAAPIAALGATGFTARSIGFLQRLEVLQQRARRGSWPFRSARCTMRCRSDAELRACPPLNSRMRPPGFGGDGCRPWEWASARRSEAPTSLAHLGHHGSGRVEISRSKSSWTRRRFASTEILIPAQGLTGPPGGGRAGWGGLRPPPSRRGRSRRCGMLWHGCSSPRGDGWCRSCWSCTSDRMRGARWGLDVLSNLAVCRCLDQLQPSSGWHRAVFDFFEAGSVEAHLEGFCHRGLG